MRATNRNRNVIQLTALLGIALTIAIAMEFYDPSDFSTEARMLRVSEHAGIENPLFEDHHLLDMSGQEDVAGIVIDGKPYAFLLHAMEGVSKHVVNMNVDGTAVAMTYCDLSGCVRALKKEGVEESLRMGVGGVARELKMVVTYGGRSYTQDSARIPLEDVHVEKSTWSSWVRRYPDTLIYMGETKTS